MMKLRLNLNRSPFAFAVISCLELLPPPNGKFSALQSFEFGSTLTVACSEGYFLTGTPSVSCEDRNNDGNGEWNGTLAVCERKNNRCLIFCPCRWQAVDSGLFAKIWTYEI